MKPYIGDPSFFYDFGTENGLILQGFNDKWIHEHIRVILTPFGPSGPKDCPDRTGFVMTDFQRILSLQDNGCHSQKDSCALSFECWF